MKLLMENWRKFLAEEEKDFEAHMMFDPKTGDKKQAKTEAEHNELAKKGYVHTDPAKIRKALEDEGGAAGTDAIVDRTDASGEEVKKAMDAMPDVAQHDKGDYILGDKDKIKIEEDCWDGYERVPGSKEGAPGSCRKKTNEESCDDDDERNEAQDIGAMNTSQTTRYGVKGSGFGDGKKASQASSGGSFNPTKYAKEFIKKKKLEKYFDLSDVFKVMELTDLLRKAGADTEEKVGFAIVDYIQHGGKGLKESAGDKEARIRDVVKMGSWDNIDGTPLSLPQAELLVKAMDAMNPANKQKLLAMPMKKMLEIVNQLVDRGVITLNYGRAREGLEGIDEDQIDEASICKAGKDWVDGKTIGGQKVSRGEDGKFNNWSARAAQIASKYCKDPNYGRGKKKKKNESMSEGDLGDWEKENWTHSDGTPCGGGDKDGSQSRCKPASKWKGMSKGEKAADNAKKKAGTDAGKQYVSATKKGKVTKAHTKEAYVADVLAGIFEGCGDRAPVNYDHGPESAMHRSSLHTIKGEVEQLLYMIGEQDDLPEWLEAKITKARSYLSAAKDYLSGEQAEMTGALEEQLADAIASRFLDEENLDEKPAKGKKSSKTVTNPETGRKKKVSYGQKGSKISPGTDKGHAYCARSYAIKQSLPKDKKNDPNTPNNLSRKKWKCSGERSRKGK